MTLRCSKTGTGASNDKQIVVNSCLEVKYSLEGLVEKIAVL